MGHEIDLKNYKIRTDLVLETIENNNSNAPKGNDNSVDNGTKEEAATSNASVEKKAE